MALFSPHASADGDRGAPTVERELPAGRTVEVDGETLHAFTARELAEIVKLEDDYHWFWANWLRLSAAHSIAVGEELQLAEKRVLICRESLDLVTADREILRAAWKDERRLRLDARNEARIREWVPWAIVVVESVAFGVVGVWAGVSR